MLGLRNRRDNRSRGLFTLFGEYKEFLHRFQFILYFGWSDLFDEFFFYCKDLTVDNTYPASCEFSRNRTHFMTR